MFLSIWIHGRKTQILITQKNFSVKFPINFNIFAHGTVIPMCPKLYRTMSETTKILSQGLKETQRWKASNILGCYVIPSLWKYPEQINTRHLQWWRTHYFWRQPIPEPIINSYFSQWVYVSLNTTSYMNPSSLQWLRKVTASFTWELCQYLQKTMKNLLSRPNILAPSASLHILWFRDSLSGFCCSIQGQVYQAFLMNEHLLCFRHTSCHEP